MLEINNLHASIKNLKILNGINLKVKPGEIHALMGPNGSGKSTLSLSIMGHPNYKTKGSIKFYGKEIISMPTHQRARLGLFMAFQHPSEVTGVSIREFLKVAYETMHEKVPVFRMNKWIDEKLKELHAENKFAERYLNEGFSGGEKKKSEVLQMALLKPKIAILDEIDSGLDIDALRTLSTHIKKMVDEGLGVLIITHYARILEYLSPDYVHIMINGKIVKSGGAELATELEKTGYGAING